MFYDISGGINGFLLSQTYEAGYAESGCHAGCGNQWNLYGGKHRRNNVFGEGGYMKVKSKLGEGSVFGVYLRKQQKKLPQVS